MVESTIDPEIDKSSLHPSKTNNKKALFPKALYCPNQMTPMPSDCIENPRGTLE